MITSFIVESESVKFAGRIAMNAMAGGYEDVNPLAI